MLGLAIPCYAVPYHTMLCCATLCYAVPHASLSHRTDLAHAWWQWSLRAASQHLRLYLLCGTCPHLTVHKLSWEHLLEIEFSSFQEIIHCLKWLKEFLHTDRICSAQHAMATSTGALLDAAWRQAAQHLKGCKILLTIYTPLFFWSSYLVKSFVVGPFLQWSKKIPTPAHSHLTPIPAQNRWYLVLCSFFWTIAWKSDW